MMMLQPRDLEIPTAALGLRETVENRAESSTMPLCHTANVDHVYSTRYQKGADLGISDFYRSTRYR